MGIKEPKCTIPARLCVTNNQEFLWVSIWNSVPEFGDPVVSPFPIPSSSPNFCLRFHLFPHRCQTAIGAQSSPPSIKPPPPPHRRRFFFSGARLLSSFCFCLPSLGGGLARVLERGVLWLVCLWCGCEGQILGPCFSLHLLLPQVTWFRLFSSGFSWFWFTFWVRGTRSSSLWCEIFRWTSNSFGVLCGIGEHLCNLVAMQMLVEDRKLRLWGTITSFFGGLWGVEVWGSNGSSEERGSMLVSLYEP